MKVLSKRLHLSTTEWMPWSKSKIPAISFSACLYLNDMRELVAV